MLFLRLFSVRALVAALREGWIGLTRNSSLIVHMTRRELQDRYAGQALGVIWAFAGPLLTMFTYVFAFAFIFNQRAGPHDSRFAYTAYALAALVPWMAMTDIASRATATISGSGNLVKQIVFPVEVLPLKCVLAAAPQMLVGLCVAIVTAAVAGVLPARVILLLPPACALFLALATGISYLLAALGVFFKDIKEFVSFLTSIGLFLHPVLYGPDAAPAWFSGIFALSPMSHMIWCFRDALYAGPIHVESWVVVSLFSIFAYAAGWRFFRMLRPTFGNAL